LIIESESDREALREFADVCDLLLPHGREVVRMITGINDRRDHLRDTSSF
jgi:hypothetical protein